MKSPLNEKKSLWLLSNTKAKASSSLTHLLTRWLASSVAGLTLLVCIQCLGVFHATMELVSSKERQNELMVPRSSVPIPYWTTLTSHFPWLGTAWLMLFRDRSFFLAVDFNWMGLVHKMSFQVSWNTQWKYAWGVPISFRCLRSETQIGNGPFETHHTHTVARSRKTN